jgi:hypothetical protein
LLKGHKIKNALPNKPEEHLKISCNAYSNLSVSDTSELNLAPFSASGGMVVKTSQGQFPLSFWIRIILKNAGANVMQQIPNFQIVFENFF